MDRGPATRPGAGADGHAAEHALERLLRQHGLILETAAEGIFGLDADGRTTFVNPAAAQMLGWPADALIGRRRHDVVHHTHSDGSRFPLDECPIEQALGEGVTRRVDDEVFWRRDGTSFPVEYTATPIREDGRLTGAVVTFRDVSERRRAEQYFRAQHAVTKILAEARTVGTAMPGILKALATSLGFDVAVHWPLDPTRERLWCADVWHRPTDELDAFEDATRAERIERGAGLPGRVWATGVPAWVEDVRVEDVAAEIDSPRRLAAVEDGLRGAVCLPVGRGDGFLGVIELVNREPGRRPDARLLEMLWTIGEQVGQFIERREAEAEAERLKDEFFALVSHELRTPLTAIAGYVEVLGDDADRLDERQRRSLEVIARNSERLRRLVGDLLFVAQLETGRLSLEPGTADLAAVAAQSVEAAAPRARERGVALTLEVEDGIPTIAGDAERLGQLVDNLVSNAIKFTDSGGSVAVRVDRRDGAVCLAVSDTGIGIPADDQRRLFERFFRASTATARQIPGVGLGLSISKAIAEGHGGRISVRSEERAGTTFTVELPMGAPAVEQRDPAARAPTG